MTAFQAYENSASALTDVVHSLKRERSAPSETHTSQVHSSRHGQTLIRGLSIIHKTLQSRKSHLAMGLT